MTITIREAGNNTQVEASNGTMLLSADETISLMENAKVAGYDIRIELEGINEEVRAKAMEMAGLSGFQAAKQAAKGFVEI